MRIKSKHLKHALLSLSFFAGSYCYGQQLGTVNTEIRAKIIAPIAITKTADMDFGNVAVSQNTGGTVIMSPSGNRVPTGGVVLPTISGNPAAASFTVVGEPNYSYVISLPASATLSDGMGHTMTMRDFTSNPPTTGTLISGSQSLTIGATLNVNAGQETGNYSTQNGGSNFDVTVNYY